MSVDKIAMVAATLVTTTLGANQYEGSSNELSIADAAAAAGIPETAVNPAKAARIDLRVVVAELQNTVTWQGMLIDALLMTVAELAPRVDASLPVVLPPNFVRVKAVNIAGVPEKTIYRWARQGLIDAVKLNGKLAIDRLSLERHVASLVRK